ncbi:hydrogenase small subunit [Thermincola ferriacetica]
MLSRREFIKLMGGLAAGIYAADFVVPELAAAFAGKAKVPVIWLEMMTCSGNVFSALNTLHPGMRELLFDIIELRFSNSIMFGEGDQAIEYLFQTIEQERGRYILIAEGTVSTKANGYYSLIGYYPGGRPLTSLEAIKLAAGNAKYIMSLGTCASFGGPYAAKPNPSGSKPVMDVIEEPVVNVPGCPVNPDWCVGTLIHLILYGMPDLDGYRRPTMFYGKRIHDWCPRRQHFDNGNFASRPGEEACTYKIGCKGPVTFADCPTRQWNSEHVNWPVGANSPCIGCVEPGFPDAMSPFFEHLPDAVPLGIRASTDAIGLGVAGAVTAGISAHLVASTVSGRIGQRLIGGTEAKPTGLSDIVPGSTGNKRIIKLKPAGRDKQIGLKRHWKQLQVNNALPKQKWYGALIKYLPKRKGR